MWLFNWDCHGSPVSQPNPQKDSTTEYCTISRRCNRSSLCHTGHPSPLVIYPLFIRPLFICNVLKPIILNRCNCCCCNIMIIRHSQQTSQQWTMSTASYTMSGLSCLTHACHRYMYSNIEHLFIAVYRDLGPLLAENATTHSFTK